jgi:hypothetical protein
MEATMIPSSQSQTRSLAQTASPSVPTGAARTDFYTLVHKSLRKRLFEAAVRAGTTDYTDDEERTTLEETVAALVLTLREHAANEERFIHPILEERLPDLAATLSSEHEEHDRALADLERAFTRALAERTALATHGAYRALARFLAFYLEHLEREEASQPAIWAAVPEARLAAAMAAFRASRTPAEMQIGMQYMLAAMNASERAAMQAHALTAREPANRHTAPGNI